VTEREIDGWTAFDVAPITPSTGTARRGVYLHGGCYCFEITAFHWRLVAELASQSGATITVPILPLAPAGTASVVVRRVVSIVETAISEVGAHNVSVIGDSSGGGMALATAMALRDRHPEPLRAIALIAPWLDISGTDPVLQQIAPSDQCLAIPGLTAAGALYRAELDEADWRVSPLRGNFEGLGPITLISGTRDILYADALRMVPLARDAGVDVDWTVGEGMMHVYPLFPMPEAIPAREALVRAIS